MIFYTTNEVTVKPLSKKKNHVADGREIGV